MGAVGSLIGIGSGALAIGFQLRFVLSHLEYARRRPVISLSSLLLVKEFILSHSLCAGRIAAEVHGHSLFLVGLPVWQVLPLE